jgi:hypothetical protein
MTSPISIFHYQDPVIKFTQESTNLDFQLIATDSELEEFTRVESPKDLADVQRWIATGGFVPEVVIDFITHSRANWQEIDEDGNVIDEVEKELMCYINQ